MVAIYPTGIKTFVNKTDFTDIVDAGDINTAYDEIKAVENTLGTLPAQDTIDGSVSNWGTVRDRMTALRRGVSRPFCNVVVNSGIASFQEIPNFTGKTWDTHGMWSGGSNLICPRDGVYTISYAVHWDHDTSPVTFPFSGVVASGLTILGQTRPFVGMTEYYPQGWASRIDHSGSLTMPWNKGSAIYLVLNITTIATISFTASVSALFERDAPTVNNL